MTADFKAPKRIRDKEALRRFRLERLGEPCSVCELRTGVDPHHIQYRSQGGDDTPENLLWLIPMPTMP